MSLGFGDHGIEAFNAFFLSVLAPVDFYVVLPGNNPTLCP